MYGVTQVVMKLTDPDSTFGIAAPDAPIDVLLLSVVVMTSTSGPGNLASKPPDHTSLFSRAYVHEFPRIVEVVFLTFINYIN